MIELEKLIGGKMFLYSCVICSKPNTSRYATFKEKHFAVMFKTEEVTLDNKKIICICDRCASNLAEDNETCKTLHEKIPYEQE